MISGALLGLVTAEVARNSIYAAEFDVSSDEIELEAILVEGSLIEDTVLNTPKNVSVVTALDIEQAPGKKLIEILSSQAGVSIMSYSGHDKQSSVDLRGMGAAANSNVLVMVDGIRLNAPDLSGADLSSIQMEEIEKIEIIHGGESVVYGDGAVGGVVRIYTKKPKQGSSLKVQNSVRSFDTVSASLQYSGKDQNLSAGVNGAYFDTDGYRDNGFYTKTSAGFNFSYDLSDSLSLSLVSSNVNDAYGLPGAVSIDDIDSPDKRRKTDHPNDRGETRDQRLTGNLELNLDNQGSIKLMRGYRSRYNSYILGYNADSDLSEEEQMSHIDEETRSLRLVYSQPYSLFSLQHTLKCGLDHYKSYYVRDSLSQNERHNSNTESLGMFLMNRWSLGKKAKVNLGYRLNRLHGLFRSDKGSFQNSAFIWKNGDLIEKEWENQSYDVGVSYQKDPETNFFLALSSSFRTPNVDEFALADEDLKPQQSQNADLGIHYKNADALEYSITIFQISTEDEIYYGIDPSTGITENRNYEDVTLRQGVETEVKFFASDLLLLWANGSFIRAEFEGKGTKIPLVPTYKTTLGLEYGLTDQSTLSITGTWVGERCDGNDESNSLYEKLKAYNVINTKFSYDFYKGRKLHLGINNLFNTLYSNIAYSEAYYPMPTRDVYCELKWEF